MMTREDLERYEAVLGIVSKAPAFTIDEIYKGVRNISPMIEHCLMGEVGLGQFRLNVKLWNEIQGSVIEGEINMVIQGWLCDRAPLSIVVVVYPW